MNGRIQTNANTASAVNLAKAVVTLVLMGGTYYFAYKKFYYRLF